MNFNFDFAFFSLKSRRAKTFMRMKLFAMIMLLSVLQLTAAVKGQNAEVSMMLQEVSLVEFFNEVKQQTEYDFLYNYDLVMSKKKVSVKVDKENLKEILSEVLYARDLEYSFEDNVIIIAERKQPRQTTKKQQEKRVIEGVVTDETGVPLPGVSVVIKGTSIGTATDIDGKFFLKVPSDAKTLIVSFIGMQAQEIPYHGQAMLNVTLQPDNKQIGEVVITGYQTIKKGRATGSFQIVKNEDLSNIASVDLTKKLEGLASGLKVNRDGNILIRGKATLSADSEPLIVVDGFPWMGNLSELNTDDIDQLTVLKDAASTSIYGVRGANGVIVITTKRGKKDSKLNVNYANNFQITEKPDIEDLDLMNSTEAVDLEWATYEAAGLLSYPSYNYKSEVGEIFAAMKSGAITEAEAMQQLDVLKSYDNQEDLERYFFQREMVQKHTLSFDFGNEKNQFYASLSYDENRAKWKGTGGNNISFTMNDDFKFNDFFAVHLNLFGNYRKSKMNGQYASMTRPYVRLTDEAGNYVDEAHGQWDNATETYYEEQGLLDFSYNQLQERELRDRENKSNNIATNLSFDITPINGVKLTTSVGYNVINSRSENFQNKYSYEVRSLINKFTDANHNQVIPYGGILKYSTGYSENLTLRSQLSVNKQVKDFDISFNAGVERNAFKTRNDLGNVRFNYHPQRLTESPVDWKTLNQGYLNYYYGWSSYYALPNVSESENRYLSYYAVGNVTFKEKYDLFASWRLDKTNLFGRSSKYRDQPAWSVGGKWAINKEDFFDLNFVDRLGLKASFGLAGNVDKNTSPFMIASASNDSETGASSLTVINPENPQLGWEKSYTTNIGVDFALFNNKIAGAVEYYNKRTKDVLAPVAVDPTTGFGGTYSFMYKNNGEILNRGVDLNVSANVLTKRDFRYDVNLNFSWNYNEVVKVDQEASSQFNLIFGRPVAGKPIDYIYGYRSAGLDSEGEPMVYNKDGEKVSWTEMGSFDKEDGVFMGRQTPPVFGSFTNTFTWKNFTADVFITYDFGHKVKMYDDPSPISNAPVKNTLDINKKRWQKPGDEAHTSIPKLYNTPYVSLDRSFATWQSDFNIDNADLIRLKSINLSYDFTSLLNSKKIKSLKLRAGVENLWYWTAASNGKVYDRKVSNFNRLGERNELSTVRSFYFPDFRNFTFGVTMQF